MLRFLLHATTIPLYTLVLGLLAILFLLLVPGSAPLFWFARPWARLIAATCGTRVRACGLSRIPTDRPCVFMSNHQSHFDLIALLTTLPGRFAILAKRELFFIPVFGWALWLAGMVPVDRSNRESAIRSVDRAAEQVRNGRSVLIFAEGTRSADGTLQPFKKGGFHLALKAGAPIVPVSVRGGHGILPKGSLRIRPGLLEVTVGEPIETRPYASQPLESLMAAVREALVAGLGPARAEGTP